MLHCIYMYIHVCCIALKFKCYTLDSTRFNMHPKDKETSKCLSYLKVIFNCLSLFICPRCRRTFLPKVFLGWCLWLNNKYRLGICVHAYITEDQIFSDTSLPISNAFFHCLQLELRELEKQSFYTCSWVRICTGTCCAVCTLVGGMSLLPQLWLAVSACES